MRPIWTGAIGFGLVNIQVKMYSATERSELDLDMLDKNDLSRALSGNISSWIIPSTTRGTKLSGVNRRDM